MRSSRPKNRTNKKTKKKRERQINQKNKQLTLTDRIFQDYLVALQIVIITILCTLFFIHVAGIPFARYFIPLKFLWILFVVEAVNILRITYEEYRNKSNLPLFKKQRLIFLFYPILSGLWFISPWVLHKKNISAVYFSIQTYQYYWIQQKDIDKGCEPGYVVFLLTGEAPFLHLVSDGIHFGNEVTFKKSKERFLDIVSNKHNWTPKKFLQIYKFMIEPLLMLYHPNMPKLKARIDILFDELYSPEFLKITGESIKRLSFYHRWKIKRQGIKPKLDIRNINELLPPEKMQSSIKKRLPEIEQKTVKKDKK